MSDIITEEIKKDFDAWVGIHKQMIETLFEPIGKTYGLKANPTLAKKIQSIHEGIIINYIASSIETGKGMNVFTFLISFHKVTNYRNKIAQIILDNGHIVSEYKGIPSGQTGIAIKNLKNSNHKNLNQIAYWLINECDQIEIDKNLNIFLKNTNKKISFKSYSPIYKNVLYHLCPERFYPSDSNTTKTLKKRGIKHPLLAKIEDKYESREVSYKSFFNINEYEETGENQMSPSEYINLLKARNQIILQGPPGTGKTRLAKIIARNIINKSNEENPKIDDLGDQVKLIQFHPSYSYEDFVRGISAKTTNSGIEYIVENKILAKMAQDAQNNKKPYILIIDEINRANLSSVLGELIYALEYRDEAVESMYALKDGSRDITLPSNLYIIGTMNTADRSIGHIDYAIRRRFAFADVLPNKDIVSKNSKFEEVQKLFKNKDGSRASTLSPEFNPDDVMLGHSYFIGKNEKELKEKLEYQVIPLLKEYIKDGVLNESVTAKIKELTIEKNSKDTDTEESDEH